MILLCFVLQLLNWYKRRHSPVDGCRLYRLAPHCAAAPTYLVLKAVPQPQLTSLDPRGVFVAHCQDELYLWQVGCLISWVIWMHEPITVFGNRPDLLTWLAT